MLPSSDDPRPVRRCSRVTPEAYNYANFILDEAEIRVFRDFRDQLHVGDAAPDGALVDLGTGETVRLSELWTRKHLILEFGSYT